MKLYPLTAEEQQIILQKGTEHPGTGELLKEHRKGTYLCRQCHHPLYTNEQKFDSGCGWPAFDDQIPGAVKWTDDPDGSRTEISCASCGGHLGHVFIGEHMTEKNTRHCVNSLSMIFTTQEVDFPLYSTIYLGGGCFWCIEGVLQQLKGIIQLQSGYMGGKRPFPSYEQVCSGTTGHIEVVKVIRDETILPLEILLDAFFTSHDPTSMDRQGNDAGSQYRSAIFTTQEQQKTDIQTYINQLKSDHIYSEPIVTQIQPASEFWIAEGYHQNYYTQHETKPYCQIVINPKIQHIRKHLSSYLK